MRHMSNRELYGRLLDAILSAFASVERRIPTEPDMASIRGAIVGLSQRTPDAGIVSARATGDGQVTVVSDLPDEQSFAA